MLSKIIEKAKMPLIQKSTESRGIYYDIIGDVHGNAGELIRLLKQMEYSENEGIWGHKHRKAIFVGDFTCRGPQTRGSLNIVRAMVENDTAYAILGNHEMNVIGHFTKDKEGIPFKLATGSNKKIMDRIKEEYIYEKSQLKDDIKWLRRLPFFLEFDNIRITHAYWSSDNKKLIEESISEKKLTKKLLRIIFTPGTPLSEAVRQTTRGIEVNLPHDLIIKDNRNIRRTNFRINWWEDPKGKTFKQISYGNKFILPDYTIPPEILFPFQVYPSGAPLVFIGHYCMAPARLIPVPNVCCVDSCVANDGHLAAYRWNGELTGKVEHLVFQKKI